METSDSSPTDGEKRGIKHIESQLPVLLCSVEISSSHGVWRRLILLSQLRIHASLAEPCMHVYEPRGIAVVQRLLKMYEHLYNLGHFSSLTVYTVGRLSSHLIITKSRITINSKITIIKLKTKNTGFTMKIDDRDISAPPPSSLSLHKDLYT